MHCSLNVMHCRKEQEAPEKEICSTCLSQESILAIPFGISKHPLSTRSRFLRATVRSTSSTILWLHHAHPFVAATEKNLSHAEKQKVWSRSCALQGLLCTIVSKIWIIYRILIVLLVMTCDCCKPMNSCRDWAFSNSGLEVGLPAFQLPMFSKCDALPKTDFCDCLSKESMAFVKSKPPLPTTSLRLLRAAVHATSSALWLQHAHPFVAAERRKKQSHAEKQRVWSRSCGRQYF